MDVEAEHGSDSDGQPENTDDNGRDSSDDWVVGDDGQFSFWSESCPYAHYLGFSLVDPSVHDSSDTMSDVELPPTLTG